MARRKKLPAELRDTRFLHGFVGFAPVVAVAFAMSAMPRIFCPPAGCQASPLDWAFPVAFGVWILIAALAVRRFYRDFYRDDLAEDRIRAGFEPF